MDAAAERQHLALQIGAAGLQEPVRVESPRVGEELVIEMVAGDDDEHLVTFADRVPAELDITFGEAQHGRTRRVQPHRLQERGAQVLLRGRVHRARGVFGERVVFLADPGERLRVGQQSVEQERRGGRDRVEPGEVRAVGHRHQVAVGPLTEFRRGRVLQVMADQGRGDSLRIRADRGDQVQQVRAHAPLCRPVRGIAQHHPGGVPEGSPDHRVNHEAQFALGEGERLTVQQPRQHVDGLGLSLAEHIQSRARLPPAGVAVEPMLDVDPPRRLQAVGHELLVKPADHLAVRTVDHAGKQAVHLVIEDVHGGAGAQPTPGL